MTEIKHSSFLGLIILAFYCLVRFGLGSWMDTVGTYTSLVFEFLFVLIVLSLYRDRIRFFGKISLKLSFEYLLAFIAGFLVFKYALKANFLIPFDFSSLELVLMMLVVGPLLEEAVFRNALWHAVESFSARPWVAWIATSLFFSFSHFYSIFFVHQDLHGFIYYQTVYTLLVSLWWGSRLLKKHTMSTTVLFHFVFNLGFYLASRV